MVRAATFDSTDQRLIGLLRQDARLPVATLAAKLGVSRGTVNNRLAKLQKAGVIVGYTVQLRPDAQPDQIRAWMGIDVEGNQTREVVAHLLGEPGIAGAATTRMAGGTCWPNCAPRRCRSCRRCWSGSGC